MTSKNLATPTPKGAHSVVIDVFDVIGPSPTDKDDRHDDLVGTLKGREMPDSGWPKPPTPLDDVIGPSAHDKDDVNDRHDDLVGTLKGREMPRRARHDDGPPLTPLDFIPGTTRASDDDVAAVLSAVPWHLMDPNPP